MVEDAVSQKREPEQIALPMTGNGAVFNLCRSFPNRDGIDDLTTALSASQSVL
jgi:hypothetical protein